MVVKSKIKELRTSRDIQTFVLIGDRVLFECLMICAVIDLPCRNQPAERIPDFDPP